MTEADGGSTHVRSEMREFLAIDGPERLWSCWDRIWIATPSTKEAFKALTGCMKAPASTKPRGLVLAGESDTGKSRVMKAFREANPPEKASGSEYSTVPVIYLRGVTAPDPVSFLKDILADLGHPLIYNPSEPDLKRHTIRMVKNCQVGVILIDEFNDILNDYMNKKVVDFLRFLKGIVNQTERPLVVSGTPSVLDVARSESQIGSRLNKEVRLQPFKLREFVPVALAFEQMLPLRQASQFRSDERVLRALYEDSQGYIGRLSNVLNEACEIAIDSGEERITLPILQRASAARIQSVGQRR